MRLGDTIAIFCQRCHRVTNSQAEVCDVDLGGQLVIDNILCTVCGRCGKITSLAARDAVRVDNRPRLTESDRAGMDEVLTMVGKTPPATAEELKAVRQTANSAMELCSGALSELEYIRERGASSRRLGQVFYGGLGTGTVLAGIAFSYPEYAIPSFLSFAAATGLYSAMLRLRVRG
jgi:hypothetical protein